MKFFKSNETLALALFTAGALTSITVSLGAGCAGGSSSNSPTTLSAAGAAAGLSTAQTLQALAQISGKYSATMNAYTQDPSTGQTTNPYTQGEPFNLILSVIQQNGQSYAALTIQFADGSQGPGATVAEISADHKSFVFYTVSPWQSADVSSLESFAVYFELVTTDGVHIDQTQSQIYFLDCGSVAVGVCTTNPLNDARVNAPVTRVQ